MQKRYAQPVNGAAAVEPARQASTPDPHSPQTSTLELLRDAGIELNALRQTLSPDGRAINALGQQICAISSTIERAGVQARHLEEQVTRMRYQAYHDPLTRLPNRALLFDRLGQAMARAARQAGQLALLLLDLDEFKAVNDRFGHAVGDRLLRSVAERLIEATRNSDTTCRYGGDEFVILLPDVEGAEGTAAVARKIQTRLANPFVIESHSIAVNVSIGFAVYPSHGTTARELFHRADIAMYQSKHRPNWYRSR